MGTDRLNTLLDAVWEHSLPLGPFGDPDERNRLAAEWEATLSEDDCLELLRWMRAPVRPTHWHTSTESWVPGMPSNIASHVGNAARRHRTPRLLSLLLDLLTDANCRDEAFCAVFGLEESDRYDLLLMGADIPVVPINNELARVMTEAQAARLRQVADAPGTSADVRVAIRDILRGLAELGP